MSGFVGILCQNGITGSITGYALEKKRQKKKENALRLTDFFSQLGGRFSLLFQVWRRRFCEFGVFSGNPENF